MRRTAPLLALVAVALLVVGIGGAVAVRTEHQIDSRSTPSPPVAAAPGQVGAAPPVAVPWSRVTWRETPHALESGGELVGIHGASAFRDTIVAWARVAAPGRNQFNELAAVLVSTRGGPWRSSVISHGVGAEDTAELTGVAVGAGGLLAYGGTCCAVEERAVWHSVDGARWTRLPIHGDLDPRAVWFTEIVDTGAGWVAAATSLDRPIGGLWHSVDGSRWERAELDLGDLTYRISDLEAGKDGVFAVGTLDAADETHDGLVLHSTDGRRWDRLAADDPVLADEETELHRIVEHAGGLWVTGNHGGSDERRRCEDALGMTGSTEPLPPPMTALSCGWGRMHHWVSHDGTAWERIDPDAEAGDHPIEYRAAAAGGPGVLVLSEANGPASPDTMLFASPDGRSWTALGAEHPLLGTLAYALGVEGDAIYALVERWDGAMTTTYQLWIGSAGR